MAVPLPSSEVKPAEIEASQERNGSDNTVTTENKGWKLVREREREREKGRGGQRVTGGVTMEIKNC